MTISNELGQEKKFVRAILPWLLALAALVLYAVTLNRWVSMGNLFYVARASGQIWTPELTGPYGKFGPYAPLYFLVTYPIRWLPPANIPIALNLVSLVCGVLALAVLARSVAILPHDRTHEQRQREQSDLSLLSLPAAWIPPLLAVAACGLQLTFWESATAGTGEMFDLLLFAYVIRCLLEYRISQRESWLTRAALIFGAAMANNWLMIGVLPAFITALIWIRGLGFFNLRFLRNIALCGCAGLLLYLLLPLVHVLSQQSSLSFWQALKLNIASQKDVLSYFIDGQRINRTVELLLAVTSFLPILLIAVRWASYFGDPSKLGIALTTGMLHLAHAALMGVCIWVAFDPIFSPRHKGISLLPLSYLGALSIGYFAGYFLLVFIPLPDRFGRIAGWQVLLSRTSTAVIWALLLLVPAGLLYKNIPAIRATNGPAVQQYASLLTRTLPERSIVLSDDPTKLFLAEAWLAHEGKATNYVFLDTQSLMTPGYHRLLQKRYAKEIPPLVDPKRSEAVSDLALINLMAMLSEKTPIYYLHFSFGYYFEYFYQQPHGLVFELRRYPTNSLARLPLSDSEIAENEKFWDAQAPVIADMLSMIHPPPRGTNFQFRAWLMRKLRIPFDPNPTGQTLSTYYSQALNTWGVQLQRAGKLERAGECFDTSAALNAENIAAKANVQLNRTLQAGKSPKLEPPRPFDEEFGKFRNWQQVLRETGPFDDPTHCFGLATTFLRGSLFRQAAQQLERVNQLVPDYAPAQFWLARLYGVYRLTDQSLQLIAHLRSRPESLEGAGIRKLDLLQTEAAAYYAADQPGQAGDILEEAMQADPKNQTLLAMAFQVSLTFKGYTNAMAAVDRELQILPNDGGALVSKGFLDIQLNRFDDAVSVLSKAITLNTNNSSAKLYRAYAYLSGDKLDQAQSDYEGLEKVFRNPFQIYYGLGEIAWRRKDTNTAIRYYQMSLSNAMPDSAEARTISARLKGIKTP